MKFLLAIILIGLVVVAGGVGYILANGFDFPDFEAWKIAIEVTVATPLGLLNGTEGAADRALFEGMFAAVAGGFFTLGSVGLLALVWAVSPIWMKVKRSAHMRKKEKKETAPAKKENRTKEKVKRDPFAALRGVMSRFQKRPRESFEDAYADLEGNEGKAKRDAGFSALEWIKAKAQRKASPVVIRSADGEEIVLEAGDKASFEEELRAWYSDMRAAPKDDPEMIERARKVSARATQSARNQLTEEDPLNGEFMLRMLDSLAAKQTALEAGEKKDEEPSLKVSPDATAFSKAIEDVIAQGVGREDDDEPDLDLEAEDADDEFAIDGLDGEEDDSEFAIEDGETEDDTFALTDDQIEEDDGVDEGGEQACEEQAVAAIRAILAIEELAAAVDNFEAEWEDDLAEPDMRREHVEAAFGKLQAALSAGAKSLLEISALDLDGDEREVDWLREHLGTLAEKKSALLESVAPISTAGGFDEDDEDVDFGGAFGISEDLKTMADEDVIVDAAEIEEPEAESDHQEETEVAEDAVTEQPEQEPIETSSDDAQSDLSTAEAVDDDSEMDEIDPVGKDISEQTAEPKVDQPRDVTIGELAEVEQSGDLLYNWGYVTRGAGAAEAKISHSILAKDGLKRRVVGIVHLIAGWRLPDEDESRRLYIVMRYVPEGTWELVMDDGVKMVDPLGNFVQVKPELMHQPEIESGTLLVHFYGPGVPEDMLVEEGNVVVTTSTLSMDVLKRKMTS